MCFRVTFFALSLVLVAVIPTLGLADEPSEGIRIATFSADVTIPMGHRCMGVLPTKSQKVSDPLYVHGFVLLGAGPPIVLCAVDWCEIRNESYDQWRRSLADAAETTPTRVLVTSLHQHDAPVVDGGAAALLAEVGLAGELFDEDFHSKTIARVAQAVKDSLSTTEPVTHLGLGAATVERIASNRRVVREDGSVAFSRGSRSGSDAWMSRAPVGQIDPKLKTLSFWNGKKPLVALHAYATHPMSYYGRGEVSADFVGLARAMRQRDDFSIKQIYVSGCSGDVTAGKFNNGSPDHRQELTHRLYDAMVQAWEKTNRVPLTEIEFRNAELELPFHPSERVAGERLQSTLEDKSQTTEARILAAMGLSSRARVEQGQPIDFPCIDFGEAQLLLFPGEAFVGYQLLAQELAPDSFVVSLGYGECWPGYIPTKSAFEDGFDDSWLWAGPGSEQKIRLALEEVLRR